MSEQTAHVVVPAPDRARRSLAAGVAVFRWLAFAWMVLGNLIESDPLEQPVLAWGGIGLAGAWTLWVTAAPTRRNTSTLAIDLTLATGLIMLSGVVEPDGALAARGARLFYAATFPLGTALSWGEARGPLGGLVATVVMSIALFFSRVVNGIPIDALTGRDIAAIANGGASYLLAALAGGYTSRFLAGWADEHRTLQEAAFRAQEQAARLAEREALARRIHDSVLQALTMIAKRGTELARADHIDESEVLKLAQMAKQQEAELRALILRAPDAVPTGRASLRDALERAARACTDVPVSVSTVGALVLPANLVNEVAAAVTQALRNVEQHAEATRATVFAESTDDVLTVSVRDDGQGFDYDPDTLARAGKAGVLHSMKGRVEDLGGSMRIESRRGAGTEIEFTIPPGRVVPSGDDLR